MLWDELGVSSLKCIHWGGKVFLRVSISRVLLSVCICNAEMSRAVIKNGIFRSFLGQKRVFLKTILAESVVGHI